MYIVFVSIYVHCVCIHLCTLCLYPFMYIVHVSIYVNFACIVSFSAHCACIHLFTLCNVHFTCINLLHCTCIPFLHFNCTCIDFCMFLYAFMYVSVNTLYLTKYAFIHVYVYIERAYPIICILCVN